MKVFAIASAQPTLTPDKLQQHLPSEVQATLKLYLEGKVEQFWFREKFGPIFLFNVDSVEQAKDTLDALPLVADGLMTYELMPVTPLMPLGLLIQDK
jgi:muconolactone delta-isomerase